MPDGAAHGYIENRTFDEIGVGETASLTHTVSQRDIDLFAAATGDVNPAHVDPVYAATDMFHGVIAHGMWGAGLISAVLGTRLPGPGAIYLGQDLRFRHPVVIGDTITATVTVREKKPEKGDVTFDCVCTNQNGQAVITGVAETRAPRLKVRRPRTILPGVRIERHEGMRALLARTAQGEAAAAAFVFPVEEALLATALEAAAAGLIVPLLIGPAERIRAAALAAGGDVSALRLIDAPDPCAAAEAAVALARAGEAALLVADHLSTDELMRAVAEPRTGLRASRQLSHAYLMDVPDYPRPLLLTDAAVNISPTLAEKAAIVQNAIDLAHLLGLARPRVAILAAVETLNAAMPSTLDAAALCKMADRGQIAGGLLDGPLAFDSAVNEAAAAEAGHRSAVAGRADILVVPDLEAGAMLAKQLMFMAGAEGAGVVLGARTPIILTRRGDSARERLASCALGVLAARRDPPSEQDPPA